jgi:putative tryptophan/tyrosine transport system substrate-binding protein
MSDLRDSVVAGNLISYGPPLPAMFILAANHVDRIAKGVKTAGLPVEQPTKFELAVNPKTAKAIGIDFPATLLAC